MKTQWYKNIAALLAGALLTLAFAPFYLFPAAIVAIAVLLTTWLNTTPRQAFLRGFLFGLGLFSTGVYWIFISVHTFGEAPWPLAGLITAGLIAFLALFPALVGLLLSYLFPRDTGIKFICAFPALWVFFEWLRSFLFTGFPWLLLGYSQTNSPLKGYAPVYSVYGVSLAVAWTSALLLVGFFSFKKQNKRAIYLSAFGLILLWLGGTALSFVTWTKPDTHRLHVSLVQGNIPQELKWSADHVQLSLDRYVELSAPLWGENNLIIWPETAIPVTLQQAQNFVDALDGKAQSTKTTLMTGIPVRNPNGDGFYNALIMLGADKGMYVKRRLVPFGEYLPLPKISQPIMNFINIPMSDMLPSPQPINPLVVNGIKILTFICYEIAFPEQVRSSDTDVGLLLTINNDSWFGHSSAQSQHLQMAQMRSMEMQRPGLFVSNDGITAIIKPNGKIQSAAPQYKTFVLTDDVQPMLGQTPWQKRAMDPILILIIALFFSAIRLRKQLHREL